MIEILWNILVFIACAIGFTVMIGSVIVIVLLWMGEPRR
jgi:hypothetical protein